MDDAMRVPASQELAELPRWAQVAFAIRCARRVQPLFQATWPDAPEEAVAAIEHALRCAEQLLTGLAVPTKADILAIGAALRASNRDDDFENSDALGVTNDAALAFLAAYEAHTHAYAAEEAAFAASTVHVYLAHAECLAHLDALSGVDDSTTAARFVVRAAIALWATTWRDFKVLRAMGMEEGWTDDTRPSLESLGPLWLEGEEPNWKEAAQ